MKKDGTFRLKKEHVKRTRERDTYKRNDAQCSLKRLHEFNALKETGSRTNRNRYTMTYIGLEQSVSVRMKQEQEIDREREREGERDSLCTDLDVDVCVGRGEDDGSAEDGRAGNREGQSTTGEQGGAINNERARRHNRQRASREDQSTTSEQGGAMATSKRQGAKQGRRKVTRRRKNGAALPLEWNRQGATSNTKRRSSES